MPSGLHSKTRRGDVMHLSPTAVALEQMGLAEVVRQNRLDGVPANAQMNRERE